MESKDYQMRATHNNGQRRGVSVPPRKLPQEHKQHLTVTVEPATREWLRQNWERLGYRSESHAVDDAIKRLRESGSGRGPNEPGSS